MFNNLDRQRPLLFEARRRRARAAVARTRQGAGGQQLEGFEIIVDDDGPGIPDGAFERIFERFYTDRPEQGFGQNSGLGLSISRQIIEAHGGRIRAAQPHPRASARALTSRARRRRARRALRRLAASGAMTPPQAPQYVHANALVLGEFGLLLRGPSGAGKSDADAASSSPTGGRAALSRRLVGDDRVSLDARHGRLDRQAASVDPRA